MQALADLKARARAGTTQNPFIFFTMCHAKIFIFFSFSLFFQEQASNRKTSPLRKMEQKLTRLKGGVRPQSDLFINCS